MTLNPFTKLQKQYFLDMMSYDISGESNGTIWGAVCGNCG